MDRNKIKSFFSATGLVLWLIGIVLILYARSLGVSMTEAQALATFWPQYVFGAAIALWGGVVMLYGDSLRGK